MLRRSIKPSSLLLGAVFMPSLQGFVSVKRRANARKLSKKKKGELCFTNDTSVVAHEHVVIVLHGNLFYGELITQSQRGIKAEQ